MTTSDWENLEVQLRNGLLSSQLHQWVEKKKTDLIQQLIKADANATAEHEQIIGELRTLFSTLPNFKSFVENQIRESKQQES